MDLDPDHWIGFDCKMRKSLFILTYPQVVIHSYDYQIQSWLSGWNDTILGKLKLEISDCYHHVDLDDDFSVYRIPPFTAVANLANPFRWFRSADVIGFWESIQIVDQFLYQTCVMHAEQGRAHPKSPLLERLWESWCSLITSIMEAWFPLKSWRITIWCNICPNRVELVIVIANS